MFIPKQFKEERIEVLRTFVRANPLGTLITSGTTGLTANLVPFIFSDEGVKGTLHAHLAIANPQLEALKESKEVLVIFQGPHSYISPAWYPTTNGQAVPTWNYTMVQARGPSRVIEDPQWLLSHVTELTDTMENSRKMPWKVSDAPSNFISSLLKGIAGVEIPIEHLVGKLKVSQNQPEANRRAVAEGLLQEGRSKEMARLVARTVQYRG